MVARGRKLSFVHPQWGHTSQTQLCRITRIRTATPKAFASRRARDSELYFTINYMSRRSAVKADHLSTFLVQRVALRSSAWLGHIVFMSKSCGVKRTRGGMPPLHPRCRQSCSLPDDRI